jgi:hypothetical protein
MNGVIILPDDEILRRIKCCRDELAALKRLHRLAMAAREADEARRQMEGCRVGRPEDRAEATSNAS